MLAVMFTLGETLGTPFESVRVKALTASRFAAMRMWL